MWRRWGIAIGLVGLLGGFTTQAEAVTEVDILLDKLVQKGLLTDQEVKDVRREIAATKAPRTKELAKEVVPAWAQALSWSGDMRLRHESFWRDTTPDRHRERVRLRLGVKGKVTDQLEAGVRFATGTNLDPIATNQTAQDIFDKKDIFVDQMYLKLTTKGLKGWETAPLTVWGGKFENPFWYTSLVWDADLTPEGIAAALTPQFGPVDAVVTGGFFPIDELNADAEDPLLFGSQAGLTWAIAKDADAEWLQNLKLKTALAYYDYKNLKTGLDTTSSNRFGNTALSTSSAGTTFLQHDFNELDVIGELQSQFFGQPITLTADYVNNTSVAQADEGFQVALRLGKANKPLAWEVLYMWQRLAANAVVGQFTDSDFGEGGTNRKGHVVRVAVGTLKNSTLAAKFGVTESITTPDSAVDRLQVDWETKF